MPKAGGRWTPTHAFSSPTLLYGEGSTYQGWGQSADLTLGVAATVTPWPRAAFSPYLVTGVAAVQSWNHGHSYYQEADGSLATPLRPYSGTLGEFAPILGLGLRVRVGNRYLRLEARQWAGSLMRELTLGTALRF